MQLDLLIENQCTSVYSITHLNIICFIACGALAASISVGIVIPSTWFVYLYKILLA